MAITLYQSCGFETADGTELRTTNTVTYNSSIPPTGDYCAQLGSGSGFTMGAFDGTGRDAGGLHAVSFQWRCSSITTNGWFQLVECYATDATGDVGMSLAYDDTTGTLDLFDGVNNTATHVGQASWSPSVDTWYHICVVWEPNAASGDYAVYVDDTEMFSGTGADFLLPSGTLDVYNFYGDTEAGTMYYDDMLIWTGLLETTDYETSCFRGKVHRYRSTKASATPDGPASPTNLNAGTWSAIHGLSTTDTVNAEYTGGVSYGTVNCDDAGGSAGTGGPNTDADVGDDIYATKVILRADRSGGGGTAQYIMAHGSQTATSVTGGVTADSGTLDVSSQMTTGGGIRYSRDGTHLYVMNGTSGSGVVYQYDLTTAWDLSTASYASKSLDPSSNVTGFPSLEISSDGKYVFIGDTGTDDIFTYTLSTAWDLSTSSYTRTWSGTVLDGIAFNEDGTVACTTNNGTAPLYATFSTPWDTSTSSTSAGATPDNNLLAIQWSENGRYLLSKNGATIDVYRTTRAFDVRSLQGQPIGVNPFDPYTDATSVGAACFGNEGAKLVVLESTPSSSGNGLVKQYTLSDAYSAWNTDASFKATNMTVSADLNLTTSMTNYEVYSETVFPRSTEYLAVGVEKDGGGQDYDIAWQVGQVISIMDAPVTNIPRNVTQNPAQAGDLSTLQLTANAATVTLPDFSRTVNCTTEVLSFDQDLGTTVQRNVFRTITSGSANTKKWKGLNSQVVSFDGVNNSGGHADVANMLDGDTGTSVTPGSTFTWGKGLSAFLGGVDSTAEKPIRIDVRVYTGGNGDLDIYAGFDDTNAVTSTVTKAMYKIADNVQSTGAWSDWFIAPYGHANWDDPHNDNFTEPLTWQGIKDDFCVGVRYNGGTINGSAHAIELRIWSGETVLTTGYFDGHIDTNDSANQWTNDANLWDGSTTTWASHDAANTFHLGVQGNTLTQGTATGEIYGVYMRAHCRFRWASTNDVSLWLTCSNPNSSGGQTNNIVPYGPTFIEHVRNDQSSDGAEWEISTSNSAFWTPWISLDLDDTSWTSDQTSHLTWDANTGLPSLWGNIARGAAGSASAGLDCAKIEIAVLSAPPNEKRKGGRTKKDRTLHTSSEVLALTSPQATVDRGRGVNQDNTQPGDLTTISMTENAATISFQTPRNVVQDREGAGDLTSMEFTEAASTINASRNIDQDRGGVGDLTELQFTENQATVSFATHRNVNQNPANPGDLSTLEFTETASTVNAERIVTGATQALAFTENHTKETVNLGRNKVSGTEVITFTESENTNVNERRVVTAPVEVTAFVENASAINRERGVNQPAAEAITFTEGNDVVAFGRNVICDPEAISMASTGSVNLARGVLGTTEAVLLTDNDSTTNTARNKVSTTEVLSWSDQQSTIGRQRVVGATTEALSMASTGAVNRARNKASTTESIVMTEAQANVSTTTNLDVNCTTEAITFTETPAAVNGTRIAAATAEITAFVENASTVNAERSVLATTETLALADNDSTVTRDRVFTSPTEVVSLAEGASAIDRQRGVNAGTEALSLTENAATILRGANLDVTCTTEAITLTESAASINRTLDIAASTEVVTFVESAADIDRNRTFVTTSESILLSEAGANIDAARGVVGVTETLALADNDATVVRDRAFTTNTEAITVTENQATVDTSASNNPRNVTCTTETVSFAETAANVNGLRIVGAGVELTALAENAASINRTLVIAATTELLSLAESAAAVGASRVAQGATESITFTEAAASVSTSTNRIVNATTEQLSVQENSATSNQTRGVSSSTEILALVEQSSSIQVLRNVVATTEAAILTEAGASVSTSRVVAGVTSSLLLAESAAQVFRGANLDVNATTSAIALTETAAAVAFPRNVSGLTEQLSLTEVPATLNRPWLVVCTTEELSFTEGLAKIDKTRTGAMPGSMVWVHPEVKPVWVSD